VTVAVDAVLPARPVEQESAPTTPADGAHMAEAWFQLGGLYCAACTGVIDAALRAVPGVADVHIGTGTHRARVRWHADRTDPAALMDAVRRAGYEAVPDAVAPARALRLRERRRALWRFFVASFCAMQVMMFATPSYVAGPGELAPDLARLLNWGGWLLSLPVLVFAAGPFFRGAWAALSRGRISMDVPVALGVLVTFVASTAATFNPGGVFGSEVYFDSLTMFVAFLLGARYVEMLARHRAAAVLDEALAVIPEQAQRLTAEGGAEWVDVAALRVGDRVRVALGAAFAADGRVLQGQTQADEALLTGESRPVPKGVGDAVVGGSINLGAPVVVVVEQVGSATRYEAIVAAMRDALSQRPAVARWADAWAAPFLWVVLALAAGGALVWSQIDPSRAVWVAVAVLIVTCPCALSLSVPSAMTAAAGALARRGVLLQRLDALQALAKVNRVFFDKTGTLTCDQPTWHVRAPAGGPVPADVVAAAQGLAQWSSHPLARALAAGDGESWQAVTEQPGAGLEAEDAQGQRWRLGSLDWVSNLTESAQQAPLPQVWFGRLGAPLACFEFDECLRPDALAAVRALADAGLRPGLLSGDDPQRVHALAVRLGLADGRGGSSPEDKLRWVRAAQQRGEVVAMVGDGVNDAPVLAQADVSFAMGQGARVARAHADLVMTGGRLQDVAWAQRLARATQRVVRQNLAWSAAYNAVCIPLALAGWLPPWAAGLGMALSSLLVIANASRLLWFKADGATMA